MERRSEPRLKIPVPMRAGILDGSKTFMEGELLDMSGRGLAMRLPRRVKPGTLLRLDIGDLMMLGEVSNIVDLPDGFRVGVIVHHRLGPLDGLTSLMESVEEADARSRVEAPTWVA